MKSLKQRCTDSSATFFCSAFSADLRTHTHTQDTSVSNCEPPSSCTEIRDAGGLIPTSWLHRHRMPSRHWVSRLQVLVQFVQCLLLQLAHGDMPARVYHVLPSACPHLRLEGGMRRAGQPYMGSCELCGRGWDLQRS